MNSRIGKGGTAKPLWRSFCFEEGRSALTCWEQNNLFQTLGDSILKTFQPSLSCSSLRAPFLLKGCQLFKFAQLMFLWQQPNKQKWIGVKFSYKESDGENVLYLVVYYLCNNQAI